MLSTLIITHSTKRGALRPANSAFCRFASVAVKTWFTTLLRAGAEDAGNELSMRRSRAGARRPLLTQLRYVIYVTTRVNRIRGGRLCHLFLLRELYTRRARVSYCYRLKQHVIVSSTSAASILFLVMQELFYQKSIAFFPWRDAYISRCLFFHSLFFLYIIFSVTRVFRVGNSLLRYLPQIASIKACYSRELDRIRNCGSNFLQEWKLLLFVRDMILVVRKS